MSMGAANGCAMSIVSAVHQANQDQRVRFANKVLTLLGDGDCAGKTLAVWGLSFKAKTDDIREAPAISSIQLFSQKGIKVNAYDPVAMPNAQNEIGDHFTGFDNAYDTLDGADALVIFTDWQEFRTPDFEMIKAKLKQPVIFDGRNLYDPHYVAKQGIEYHCIGRPFVTPK
jgi:UDPglucose 6-dehydrogenase